MGGTNTHTHTHFFTRFSTVTLEKIVRVETIPACEKSGRVLSALSVCPAAERRDGGADGEKDKLNVCVCVCESHRETHSDAHTHTSRQASLCTQESAVKYQGEALTHTHTGGGSSHGVEIFTCRLGRKRGVKGIDWWGGQATYTHTHGSGRGVLPVCGRA